MNVLIYAPNWLGDAIMAMPALQEWRKLHPEDHVTLLTKRGNAPLWRLHPAVDEVVELEPGTRGTFRTGRMLREKKLDMAYLLPNSFRSALVAWLARIPRRRGVARHARALLLNRFVRLSRERGDYHQSRETAPILLEGLPPAKLPAPTLCISEEMREKTLVKFLGEVPSQPVVAMIPGAARGDSKRWPHFAEAAKRLWEERPEVRLVVLGTAAEAGLCKEVAETVNGAAKERGEAEAAVSVAGTTSLPEFATLLAAASLVVCNDSGGMHLASAVGTPVVAVFGLTDWKRTGPLGEASAIVRAEGVVGHRAIARTSRKAARVLASIPAERVVAVARYMLER